MAAVVAGFALAVWFTASWFGDCSDIGGQTTNVAGDSLRCHRSASPRTERPGCSSRPGWVVGLVLATLALLRWGGGRLRAVLLALLFADPGRCSRRRRTPG